MPEIAAAFVQPNDPVIESLLKKAAVVLRPNNKAAALNEYEGGAKRAWELASALWTTVGALGLDYALPRPVLNALGRKLAAPVRLLRHQLPRHQKGCPP